MHVTRARVWKLGWALVGIAAMLLLWWPTRARVLAGINDFLPLYAGARLAGTKGLYNAASIRRVEAEAAGYTGESWQYIRMPYYAAPMWPLGRLPYHTAYVIWQGLSLGALIAYVRLWRQRDPSTALWCCWSVPLAANFVNGQDVTFLLLWLALAIHWHNRRPFLAGLAFTLCAAKLHLFLLLPLLLVTQRRWRIIAGLAMGGAGLAAISFAAAGIHWPLDYVATIATPAVGPQESIMPNFHGMLAGLPDRLRWELVLDLMAAAGVWLVGRRCRFETGLSAALAGGLLISFHAYLADCALLIPAVQMLTRHTTLSWLRWLGMLLLFPPVYLFLMQGTALALIPRIGIVALLGGMAWECLRPRSAAAAGAVAVQS